MNIHCILMCQRILFDYKVKTGKWTWHRRRPYLTLQTCKPIWWYFVSELVRFIHFQCQNSVTAKRNVSLCSSPNGHQDRRYQSEVIYEYSGAVFLYNIYIVRFIELKVNLYIHFQRFMYSSFRSKATIHWYIRCLPFNVNLLLFCLLNIDPDVCILIKVLIYVGVNLYKIGDNKNVVVVIIYHIVY